MSGTVDKMKGRAKQAAGDLTDNDELHNDGKKDEAAGKLKDGAEKAKDKVEDAIDSVKKRT
ncbi:MAG TPA: CsbD family protein [Ilumatobacter sp.]|nr:CsbD family protein [Ilumatobacter sp.]